MGMLVNVSRTIFMSLRLAPSTARPMGMPCASTNRLRLTPCLARSVGFLPVFFPPERRLGHAAVHAQPGPIEALPFIVGHQATLPHSLKNSGAYPFLKTIMGCGTRTEARGIQRFPLTAGSQHEENGLHANPVRRPWPAATEAMGIYVLGEQCCDGLPQMVGNTPLINCTQLVHVTTSVACSCSKLTSAAHGSYSRARVIRIGSKGRYLLTNCDKLFDMKRVVLSGNAKAADLRVPSVAKEL